MDEPITPLHTTTSKPVLYAAAALLLVGTPVVMGVLVTETVPAPAPAAPVPAGPLPAPSPCLLAVIDSDPVTFVCIPAEQAG